MKEEKKYFETNHETIDVDKPLTNEELSSLIKASKDKSFSKDRRFQVFELFPLL